MKSFVALLALVCLCDARPSQDVRASPFEVDSHIIGGSNASPGAWPWQLSQQRLGTSWSHSCGASLLSSRYALSAAHCVDGSAASSLRVIAGLHDQTNTAGTQTVNIGSYTMHETYNNGASTYANDIAILTFSGTISTGGSIAVASLPAAGTNHDGATCVITGWGRTSSSNTLPNILQQATIGILSTAQCQGQASGATITSSHICVKDSANSAGACNGDSGGPVNCPGGGGYQVAGIASFVFQSGGNCLPSSPSVYTRTASYISWINTNTP